MFPCDKMDNKKIVIGWLNLAFEDWDAVKKLEISTNKGVIVYHLQQFVEKICKALISALGYEPPKTHSPSRELETILFDIEDKGMNIPKEIFSKIDTLISIARTLEDEKTRPRYGVRHADFIIPPNEYYSRETVEMFFNDAKVIAKLAFDVLRFLKICGGETCAKLGEIGEDP